MTGPTLPQLLLVAAAATACAVLLVLSAPRWRALQDDARQGIDPPVQPVGGRAPSLSVAVTAPPTRRAKPQPVRLRLVATRGDCWLVIRSGSARGPIRFEGILAQGQTTRATGRRLWVSLGAAANLDVTLNGTRLRSFPTGTIDIVVTKAGVSRALSTGSATLAVTPS